MTRRRWKPDLRDYGAPTPLKYCYASGKPMYDKKGAQTAANKRMHDSHVRLRIYNCRYCNAWHLTSRI